MPDTPRHACRLVRRVHRGVAGSTENGGCYAHPNTNTFQAERDGRFNWLSYHYCVACRRAGVIVALFLPLIIIS